jgi:hypothetical protein
MAVKDKNYRGTEVLTRGIQQGPILLSRMRFALTPQDAIIPNEQKLIREQEMTLSQQFCSEKGGLGNLVICSLNRVTK